MFKINFSNYEHKYRNWIFIRPEKLNKKYHFKSHLENIECISNALESYIKTFNNYLKNALENKEYNNLKKIFETNLKESEWEHFFNLEPENIENCNTIKSDSSITINNDEEVKNVESVQLKNFYTRLRMHWLLQQDKVQSLPNAKFQKDLIEENKVIIFRRNNINIESFCRWVENNFGEGVLSIEELKKSTIEMVLPFIPVLIDFQEAKYNCIDNINHNLPNIHKANSNNLYKESKVKCKDDGELNKNEKEKFIANSKSLNQKNKILTQKLKNAPGIKLFIDYAKQKRNGISPLGLE